MVTEGGNLDRLSREAMRVGRARKGEFWNRLRTDPRPARAQKSARFSGAMVELQRKLPFKREILTRLDVPKNEVDWGGWGGIVRLASYESCTCLTMIFQVPELPIVVVCLIALETGCRLRQASRW